MIRARSQASCKAMLGVIAFIEAGAQAGALRWNMADIDRAVSLAAAWEGLLYRWSVYWGWLRRG